MKFNWIKRIKMFFSFLHALKIFTQCVAVPIQYSIGLYVGIDFSVSETEPMKKKTKFSKLDLFP